MRKLASLLIVVLLMFSVMPMVLAEGDDADSGVDVTVENDNTPVIFTDPTDRSWNPNDQTFYTAELYGDEEQNDFCEDYYDVDVRGDYVFQGETVTYYVAVYDEDGEDNIEDVVLMKDDGVSMIGVGACSVIPETPMGCGAFASNAWVNNHFGIIGNPDDVPEYSGATADLFKFYRCQLVIQSSWSGQNDINIEATDEEGHTATSTWEDFLTINPALNVDLGGAVSFGTVEEGKTVTSNTVSLDNVGRDGVVMDMYVASDDYFTDPSNPTAICGIGNGIPYTAFSYYATKGSVDSGDNDNDFPGLGEAANGLCEAADDEFTEMPSHSGNIDDMCRIINHREEASFLTQGQSMSLTFQLDVPEPCEGAFTDGQFHFAGRVI
jgi:hypothetical protein